MSLVDQIRDSISEAVRGEIREKIETDIVAAIRDYDFSAVIESNLIYVLDRKIGDYLNDIADSVVEEIVEDELESILSNI